MKKTVLLFFAAALAMTCGCQQLKKVLNPEPAPKKKVQEPARKSSQSDWVFGKKTQLPSNLDSKLSATERNALQESQREGRIKHYDYRTDKEDNAASSWVFGK